MSNFELRLRQSLAKTRNSLKLYVALSVVVALFLICVLLTFGHKKHQSNSTQIRLMETFANGGSHQDQGRPKLFAYYVLTEQCLPNELLAPTALGDNSRLDVYVLSFLAECLLNTLPHITYFHQSNATWSAGRNLLYYYVQRSDRRYKYHIFMDDDVNLLYTEHLQEYSLKTTIERGTYTFMDNYMKDPHGFQKGIKEIRQGKSPWRAFEGDLLVKSPAFATINYIRGDGFESQVTQEFYWEKMCGGEENMPWIAITYFIDMLFIAYHEEALPLLLPYSELYDGINWSISAVFQLFRARAILPRQNVCNYRIATINQLHRFYPHDEIPNDILVNYIKKEAPELTDLIEDKYLDYKEFRKWRKYEEVFFADPTICLAPLKFPVTEHYQNKDSRTSNS